MNTMNEFTAGYVTLPRREYEDLVRAKIERDVLETVIQEEGGYTIEKVSRALKLSRDPAVAKAEGNGDAE